MFRLFKFCVYLISIVILSIFVAAEINCPKIFSNECLQERGIPWFNPFFIVLFGGLAFPVLSLMFILQRFWPKNLFIPAVLISLAFFVAVSPFLYVAYKFATHHIG